jgi:hypothetical protein
MSLIKKENLTIVIGEYTDQQGQPKKQYKTIGELITMQGDTGPYQFFKMWGPGGVVEGKVFDQQDQNSSQGQRAPQQQSQKQEQQQYQQQGYQQQGYQQPNNTYTGR